MQRLFVAKAKDFDSQRCKMVKSGDLVIGVYRRGTDYFAYENQCVHQGGPVCEGITMHKIVEILRPDKTYAGQRFDMNEEHIVCPWHGYEFNMKTGECVPDPSLKLRKFDVLTQEDSVFVLA